MQPPATPTPFHDCSYMSLEDTAETPMCTVAIESPDKKRQHTKSLRGNSKRQRMMEHAASVIKQRASDLKQKLVSTPSKTTSPVPRALDDELRGEAARQALADFEHLEAAWAEGLARTPHDFFAFRDRLERFAGRCPIATLQEEARALAQRANKAGQLLDAQNRAETYKLRGNDLYTAGMYAQAEQEYCLASQYDPQSAVLVANRAAALIMLNRFAEALGECRRAIALDATYIRAYLRGAKAALSLGDTQSAQSLAGSVKSETTSHLAPAERTRVLAEAEGIASQASTLVDLLKQADGRLALEEAAAAEKLAQQALAIAPASDRVVLVLHCARMIALAGGEPDASARALCEAVHAVRMCSSADLYRYGLLLFRRALRSEAAALLQLSLSKVPNDQRCMDALRIIRDTDTLQREATKLQAENRLDEAVRALTRALELDPVNDALNGRLLYRRAGVFLQAGDATRAEADCMACLARLPAYDKARLRLCRSLLAIGNWHRADSELTKVRLHASLEHEVRQIRVLIESARRTSTGHTRGAPPPPRSKKANSGSDLYSVLGVSPAASHQEIRKAYKKGALHLHPDKNKGKDTEEDFKKLVEAFEVLGSPTKRRAYDMHGVR